ncbi:MAG TPA: radical SAM protein, partial [Acidilobales archaeon]|nr:radical SAM protein [Acidilobales archaeon]
DNGFIPPQKIVDYALKWGDEGTCASFNEPTIHFEYLLDVFRIAKEKGLYNTMVTNASMTIEALKELRNAGLDAMSSDVKGCPDTYRRFMGIPNPDEILKTLSEALRLGIHVEVVYLIVPKANDWDECIDRVIEAHLKYLGAKVPLHINRYYPAYNYYEPPTPLSTLKKVYDKAKREGIEYVYIGNIATTDYLHTRCPKCGKVVIERTHYGVVECKLTRDNRCPYCGYKILVVGKCRRSRKLSYIFI